MATKSRLAAYAAAGAVIGATSMLRGGEPADGTTNASVQSVAATNQALISLPPFSVSTNLCLPGKQVLNLPPKVISDYIGGYMRENRLEGKVILLTDARSGTNVVEDAVLILSSKTFVQPALMEFSFGADGKVVRISNYK